MHHLHVVCSIIENCGKVLAMQRNADMSLPFKWEFPGGKIEPDESPEESLKRELMEEIGVCIKIRKKLIPNTHSYATFAITLYPFVCAIESGEIVLREHSAMAWLAPDELRALDWSEADLPVIESYLAAHELCR